MRLTPAVPGGPRRPRIVFWLQGVTLTWMLAECVVSLYAAATAHSVALLTFGADSFFGASVSNRRSDVLSGCISAHQGAGVAIGGLSAFRTRRSCGRRRSGSAGRRHSARNEPPRPWPSPVAALVVMPGLACAQTQNRKENGERALAADAVQSGRPVRIWPGLTLLGLGTQCSVPHRWIDSVAALAAIPILVIEGRRALRGESCACG